MHRYPLLHELQARVLEAPAMGTSVSSTIWPRAR